MQKSDLATFNLPDVPGVYLFKQGRKVLYVGKATSLRDRVRSYFDDDLIATRGPRVVDMVTKADRIIYETTPTVLEALVREAMLIKKYMPKANVDGKDDKSFLYAVITEEDIPRVLVVRGKDIDFKNQLSQGVALRAIYGPFPSGAQLREGLRLIRRIFPFFDTEKPIDFAQGKPFGKGKHQQAKIEFNAQIKQYPRTFDPKEYKRTIRHVMLFLSGKGKELRILLQKEMHSAAKEERFEDALRARKQLFALDHIQDVSLIKDENLQGSTLAQNSQGQTSVRIEGYDTAHLAGTNAIGVMTVLIDGKPSKRDYRTFRIRGVQKNDDIASLREILSRRLAHSEWRFPSAIVIDGGTTHKKVAESVLAEAGVAIPVVAVVKDERHRPREVLGAKRARMSDADAVLANSEAHRFSLARHQQARSRTMRVR